LGLFARSVVTSNVIRELSLGLYFPTGNTGKMLSLIGLKSFLTIELIRATVRAELSVSGFSAVGAGIHDYLLENYILH
jgi:hypothetical protein